MKIKKIHVLLCFLAIVLLSNSCVKDVDFDQVDDVVLTPVYEIDFIYSKFDTSRFVNFNIGVPVVTIPEIIMRDTLNYDFLGTDFVIDHLARIELTFEFKNTIKQDFTFDFTFLNANNEQIGPLYNMVAAMGDGKESDAVVTTEIIVFDTVAINRFKRAKKLISSMRIQNVRSDAQGILELKSKGTYFFNYKR
ncbi:hypothetical protein [Aquimarina longa]|uniref:hypothetical protein n=1 Tax=Aquimarina longa TaxID=1080221 RepID=UPI000782615F|nr:hypothetical protein [Aquimarina longa]